MEEPDMTPCLTMAVLLEERKKLGPPPRIPVGTIMSEAFYEAVKENHQECGNLGELLIDERIGPTFAHVYYDNELWRIRVKEQDAYNRRPEQ